MITDRPYRKALSVCQAIARIQQGAGSQFDPSLFVVPFLQVILNATLVVSPRRDCGMGLASEH
jgi:HD-GYP domain-containing protein (c-di-GMP phosphodiesterase class II)